jgi:hypothetical protein
MNRNDGMKHDWRLSNLLGKMAFERTGVLRVRIEAGHDGQPAERSSIPVF